MQLTTIVFIVDDPLSAPFYGGPRPEGVKMHVGQTIKVQGYVTQDKFLVGRTLAELERYLGFHSGRLARGAIFVRLARLPVQGEFKLAAYSMTAAHRHSTPRGLDISKLQELAMAQWRLTGPNRLIKVKPAVAHDRAMAADEQYPPGSGVPQWCLTKPIDGFVVAVLQSLVDRYRPTL